MHTLSFCLLKNLIICWLVCEHRISLIFTIGFLFLVDSKFNLKFVLIRGGLTKVSILVDFKPRSIKQSHFHSFSSFLMGNLAAVNISQMTKTVGNELEISFLL